MKRRILWADDEIDLLKAHIIFLEKKGYELVPVTNGQDALSMIRDRDFDAVLLDEMMPGMDGLTVLGELKNYDASLPVVMITKSEEEHIMDDALGSRISDYLIKPVNPNQIYTTLKRLLDSRQLRSERVSREYTRQLNQNRTDLMMGMDHARWAQIHANLSAWDLEIEAYNDAGLRQIHTDQKTEFNREFNRFVESGYPDWIAGEGPVMSHNILDTHVKPLLAGGHKVFFVVIDCFRLDHWLAIEPKLEEIFQIDRSHYYSILPTATPFSRNSLFSGLLPRDIARVHANLWSNAGHDERGLNNEEERLLQRYIDKSGIKLDRKPHYSKILTTDDASSFLRVLGSLRDTQLISVVYNFIDLLSHQRSSNDILQEIAPDEAAFRSLTQSWFEHSVLLDILRAAADEGATVVMTTDHGSVMGRRSTIVRGDRTTSTNVRYKYGRNLKANSDEVLIVNEPERYGLPSIGSGTTYLFAREDFYLVYPNNYRQYQRLYVDSLQHGGISMEEMILPVGVMRPR